MRMSSNVVILSQRTCRLQPPFDIWLLRGPDSALCPTNPLRRPLIDRTGGLVHPIVYLTAVSGSYYLWSLFFGFVSMVLLHRIPFLF